SACQTALGKYQSGEGYIGFSQALFLAGAHSVVLSLWKVDDTATALLMVRFYQTLLGTGEPGARRPTKAEALHQAKLWLRNLTAEEIAKSEADLPPLERGTVRERASEAKRSTTKPFDHPYYWSAFILIGDPN